MELAAFLATVAATALTTLFVTLLIGLVAASAYFAFRLIFDSSRLALAALRDRRAARKDIYYRYNR